LLLLLFFIFLWLGNGQTPRNVWRKIEKRGTKMQGGEGEGEGERGKGSRRSCFIHSSPHPAFILSKNNNNNPSSLPRTLVRERERERDGTGFGFSDKESGVDWEPPIKPLATFLLPRERVKIAGTGKTLGSGRF
jgi:hypothetical protein